MTQVKLDLDDGQTKIVNMCKLVNSLESKEKSISKIILDWGTTQSLSDKEIHNKVLHYFKDVRWNSKNTNNNENWIKSIEKKLRSAYEEYAKKVKEFPSSMVKKYKVSKKFVEEFMEEENWTEEEGDMEDTKKSDKKIKAEIFNEFQDFISKWQDETGRKYGCEIEHEEYFWSAKKDIGCLNIEYSGGKECEFFLDSYVNEAIKETTKILRGSKSLRRVIDENKAYLERMEKQASNPTPEQEEEDEARKELLGI